MGTRYKICKVHKDHHYNIIRKESKNTKNYKRELSKIVNEFVKTVPLQNRTALTQYVARRKLVLQILDDLLDKDKNCKDQEKRIDEYIFHNLIFQQRANNPNESDLWIVNEEFIYFKVSSETNLGDLMYKDEKIFKDESELTVEENEYCLKQSGDAKLKRTDILLFPDEGKCIIVELKKPSVNVSSHLNQINRYASLINNLSKGKFKFATYYGYLIGENIDIDDIRDNDSDFKSAFTLDYIFRPHKDIVRKFGRNDGSLYTEIIKHSTLLDRAKLQNKIFIDKLLGCTIV